jgi:hypothetical protein
MFSLCSSQALCDKIRRNAGPPTPQAQELGPGGDHGRKDVSKGMHEAMLEQALDKAAQKP